MSEIVDSGNTSFHVVPGRVVSEQLTQRSADVLQLVEDTYLAHDSGQTVNPDSYFLRFPDNPTARIIALPAFLNGPDGATAGIKWISSWPDNISRGIPRASAVLVLNDFETGRPIGLLEAAGISAARTAAGAAIAARQILPTVGDSGAFVGAGVIAHKTVDLLAEVERLPGRVVVCDPDESSAQRLIARLRQYDVRASHGTLHDAMTTEFVLFATNAAVPYVGPETPLRPGQLVLHVSLRDLQPELLLGAQNVFDDVEHCMKAQTSPHLLEQMVGNRDFVTGTLADLILGRIKVDSGKPTVFSPFGLGVLDLALGHAILHGAIRDGSAIEIEDFIGEPER